MVHNLRSFRPFFIDRLLHPLVRPKSFSKHQFVADFFARPFVLIVHNNVRIYDNPVFRQIKGEFLELINSLMRTSFCRPLEFWATS